MSAPLDTAAFRLLMSHYPTGVCVVTASEKPDAPIGVAFGSFVSVSLDPVLVGFLPARTSTTWPRIRDVGRFCVNLLSSGQEPVCRRFSARTGDKFEGNETRLSPNGSPILADAFAWIDCDLHEVAEAGDHWFVTGRVTAASEASGQHPLMFWRNTYPVFAVD